MVKKENTQTPLGTVNPYDGNTTPKDNVQSGTTQAPNLWANGGSVLGNAVNNVFGAPQTAVNTQANVQQTGNVVQNGNTVSNVDATSNGNVVQNAGATPNVGATPNGNAVAEGKDGNNVPTVTDAKNGSEAQNAVTTTEGNEVQSGDKSTEGNPQEDVKQPELNEDEQALLAMQNASMEDYRKRYKQASDITQGVYDYLNGGSDAEEEPYKKKNESKKKLLALADALRHIGNLFYVNKGATPQQFNSPVLMQEQRYQQEKAEREKKRASQAKAAMDKAKMDADAAYKDAMLGMKQNDFMRNVYNDNRRYGLDKDKFAWQKDKDTQSLGLKKQGLEETVRHNKANEAQGRERNAIARQRLAIARAKEAREARDAGPGSLGKGSRTFVTPQGVVYTLSRNYLQPANIVTIYNKMKEHGCLKKGSENTYKFDSDLLEQLGLGGSGGSTAKMLSAILCSATDNPTAHYWHWKLGSPLGYEYEGGMSDELKAKLVGTGKPRKAASKPKPASRPVSKSVSKSVTKPKPKKSANHQNGGRKGNNRSNLVI
jgi:hypothetical protein